MQPGTLGCFLEPRNTQARSAAFEHWRQRGEAIDIAKLHCVAGPRCKLVIFMDDACARSARLGIESVYGRRSSADFWSGLHGGRAVKPVLCFRLSVMLHEA